MSDNETPAAPIVPLPGSSDWFPPLKRLRHDPETGEHDWVDVKLVLPSVPGLS